VAELVFLPLNQRDRNQLCLQCGSIMRIPTKANLAVKSRRAKYLRLPKGLACSVVRRTDTQRPSTKNASDNHLAPSSCSIILWALTHDH